MAWDQTQPTDTTKIRNLGIVIRPNWQAIEQADSTFQPQAINFANRTPLAVSNDPTAIADSYILYCKDDAAGNPELFGIDENSVVSQFTSTDRTLAQTGYALLSPGLWIQWGRDTLSAGGGSATVTFPKAFSAPPYSVVMTVYGSPSSDASRGFGATSAASITATQFSASNYNSGFSGATPFGWMAIGPI